jgi:hypothetical protein
LLAVKDALRKTREAERHHEMYHLQKLEDYKYYVWRDGAAKAGHPAHGECCLLGTFLNCMFLLGYDPKKDQ